MSRNKLYSIKGHDGISPVNTASALVDIQDLSKSMAHDFLGIEAYAPDRLWQQAPHILRRLAAVWAQPEASDYLDGLMVSERAGRMGFSEVLLADIFFLSQLHAFLYPSLPHAASPRIEDILHKAVEPRNLRELVMRFGRVSDTATLRRRDPLADSPLRPCGWGECASLKDLQAAIQQALLKHRMLGEILIENAVISAEQLEQALYEQHQSRSAYRPVGAILRQDHFVEDEDITKALCLQSRFLLVDLDAVPMTPEAAATLTRDQANEHGVVPLMIFGTELVLAMDDPLLARSRKKVTTIEKITGLNVRVAWAPPAAIARRLAQFAHGRIEKRI